MSAGPIIGCCSDEPDQTALLCAAKKYVIKQSECPQVSVELVAADRDQSAAGDDNDDANSE